MHAFLRTLFPQLCPGCHQALRTPAALCPSCVPDRAFLTHQTVLLDTQEPHLVHLGPAEGKLRRMVHALKYQHNPGIASSLAPVLARSIPESWPIDALCPVPLHPRRMQERGYNQSEVLCFALGKHLHRPTRNLLKRTVYTHQQAKLHASARKHNLDRAFAASGAIRGLHLLLVDDVLSTGATLQACTRVLEQHGAASVRFVVLAR